MSSIVGLDGLATIKNNKIYKKLQLPIKSQLFVGGI